MSYDAYKEWKHKRNENGFPYILEYLEFLAEEGERVDGDAYHYIIKFLNEIYVETEKALKKSDEVV